MKRTSVMNAAISAVESLSMLRLMIVLRSVMMQLKARWSQK
jgi:hypothetical protein